jgi:hypothetical protein
MARTARINWHTRRNEGRRDESRDGNVVPKISLTTHFRMGEGERKAARAGVLGSFCEKTVSLQPRVWKKRKSAVLSDSEDEKDDNVAEGALFRVNEKRSQIVAAALDSMKDYSDIRNVAAQPTAMPTSDRGTAPSGSAGAPNSVVQPHSGRAEPSWRSGGSGKMAAVQTRAEVIAERLAAAANAKRSADSGIATGPIKSLTDSRQDERTTDTGSTEQRQANQDGRNELVRGGRESEPDQQKIPDPRGRHDLQNDGAHNDRGGREYGRTNAEEPGNRDSNRAYEVSKEKDNDRDQRSKGRRERSPCRDVKVKREDDASHRGRHDPHSHRRSRSPSVDGYGRRNQNLPRTNNPCNPRELDRADWRKNLCQEHDSRRPCYDSSGKDQCGGSRDKIDTTIRDGERSYYCPTNASSSSRTAPPVDLSSPRAREIITSLRVDSRNSNAPAIVGSKWTLEGSDAGINDVAIKPDPDDVDFASTSSNSSSVDRLAALQKFICNIDRALNQEAMLGAIVEPPRKSDHEVRGGGCDDDRYASSSRNDRNDRGDSGRAYAKSGSVDPPDDRCSRDFVHKASYSFCEPDSRVSSNRPNDGRDRLDHVASSRSNRDQKDAGPASAKKKYIPKKKRKSQIDSDDEDDDDNAVDFGVIVPDNSQSAAHIKDGRSTECRPIGSSRNQPRDKALDGSGNGNDKGMCRHRASPSKFLDSLVRNNCGYNDYMVSSRKSPVLHENDNHEDLDRSREGHRASGNKRQHEEAEDGEAYENIILQAEKEPSTADSAATDSSWKPSGNVNTEVAMSSNDSMFNRITSNDNLISRNLFALSRMEAMGRSFAQNYNQKHLEQPQQNVQRQTLSNNQTRESEPARPKKKHFNRVQSDEDDDDDA